MDSLARFLLFTLIAGALFCCSARAGVLKLGGDVAATVCIAGRLQAPDMARLAPHCISNL